MSAADAASRNIPACELLRISPPGSRHLRGLTFSDEAWNRLSAGGARCYLFAPGENPSKAARQYIREGEEANVHNAYKCKVRTPWWRVPTVERPDFLFGYMSHDRPRITRNAASVQVLNSLYGIRLHAQRMTPASDLLALASLNSMTLLGAEIVGRAYGGGLLKHEPREASLLPMPSEPALHASAGKLAFVRTQVANLLRRNDIAPAIDLVDRVILFDHYGLTVSQVAALRAARDTLRQRRIARGRTGHGEN